MGKLDINQIDLNDAGVINKLKSAVQKIINNSLSYFALRFKPQHYFQVPNGFLPSEGGWYIILDDTTPIYVGTSNDFNGRLNTNDGSRDNFANPGKASLSERNFIKKLAELDICKELRVCIIREKELCAELGLSQNNLNKLDRSNVEKMINIFRCDFKYK